MNRPLKFNTRNRNIFFSSDFHAFHNPNWPVPIWAARGYESWQEMNEDILNKVNARVEKGDILFYLGDLALNSAPEQVEEFLAQINCEDIYLLFGNHESSINKIYKKALNDAFGENICQSALDLLEIYPLRYENVIFCGNYLELLINKQHIVCGHFPFRIFNRSHHGSWNLSGHSHYTDKERRSDFPIGKALDVGWDGKKDIYSFEEIIEIMSQKTVDKVDHHDETVN